MNLKNKRVLNIFYYLLIFLFILFGILKIKLGQMDELWNFSFAKNISNGLLPYKDFNVIVTPLSMFVNSLFLRIDSSLISFRILYFIYYILMVYILDRIIELLEIKRIFKYILLFIIMYLLLQESYLNYNFIQLILILVLIYLSLKNKNYQNKLLNIFIPIVAGLTIINKQSTGLLICFVTVILVYCEKKDLKFSLQQIEIMLVPSILFIIYLLLSNSFFEFYDMCILGLSTFNNKLVFWHLLFILIMEYILMALLLRKYKNKELNIIFWYSIASLFVIVPIVDFTHSVYALIVPIIFFTYILNINLSKNFHGNICLLITIIVVSIFTFSNIYSYSTALKIKSGVYKSIPSNIKHIKNIDNVSKYVLSESKNHNVYILDFSSSLYNININRYTKYFDLFMNGNFGIRGKEEIYDLINKENQIILINSHVRNWQRPDDIVNYVIENYGMCGSIEQFDIYCN